MGLSKYKLGELIELCDDRNSDNIYTLDDVKGISIRKEFIETKADMAGVLLTPYILVRPNSFAYVTVTSRNGEKITLAHNTSNNTYIVSSSYIVFRVCKPNILLSDYLFMFFNRPEFDRHSRFNSWGSARETFSWDDFCDIDITLPSIEQQRKYVDVYNTLFQNLLSYENGLKDIYLTCVASIEELKKTQKKDSILPYLIERQEINSESKYSDLKGVGNEGFITPRGNRTEDSYYKCNIFYPRDFVYNPSVISKGAIAYNNKYKDPKICTEEYIVFYVKDENILSPEYLFLWLKREETGRYLEFFNMDSVRNRVYFRDLNNIKIPIPNIEIQRAIAELYTAYDNYCTICKDLRDRINSLCPILIKGSLQN
jgi:type I restriction enzyme S subunit